MALRLLTMLVLSALGTTTGAAAEAGAPLVFACSPENDLYRAVTAGGTDCPCYTDGFEAVRAAAAGAGVLILADGYPEETTAVDTAVFEEAARKRLRVYIEYPQQLPGLEVGSPRQVKFERGVVTSKLFGESLPPERIVLVSSCRYVPVPISDTHLVIARVAGVDTAVFGLNEAAAEPLLFDHPGGDLLVATTKLSHFVTGRYLPADAWHTIWQTILGRLGGGPPPELRWTPSVRPSYGRGDPLPAGIEAQAVRRSAEWIVQRSRSLRHVDWPAEALDRSRTYNTVREMPSLEWPCGDGSFGLLEGFSSTIRPDGSQPMRYAVRNDCMGEVAMLLALDAALNEQPEHAAIATRLIDYTLGTSELAAGPRADPQRPSYGLVGWALDHPESYWGDDNARALLGMGVVAALSNESRWNEPIARCILANLRTTGRNGFRPSCVLGPQLEAQGWQTHWTAEHTHCSPHYQSWIWACYLWAYQQTRFEPLLARAKTGMRKLMQAYPADWDWVLRSGTIERARLLLPLAWLVRVEDTPEHRQWLRTVAGDLVALQDSCGAIREVIGNGELGVSSNTEYGTGETSLIQTNGDPICDLLYSCNFALAGLHEAAAATTDPFYAEAGNRLAEFLCRIQIRSDAYPELDGAWYRAFDYRRWDYWASSADWEWGPWCIETGWCQPWIAGTLALRQRRTSLWDLVQQVELRTPFDRLRPQMLPDEALIGPKGDQK